MFRKQRLTILFLLSLLLVFVMLPRFNRHDISFLNNITGGEGLSFVSDRGIEYRNLSGDAQQYLLLTKYFRNRTQKTKSLLKPPFCYRPLAPLIASILPFDESTSLNLLNVFSLLMGLYLLELIILNLGVSGKPKFLALLFYVLSFPTFYYGTISYIDPFFIFLLTLGFYLLQKGKWFIFPFFIFIGVFGKEGIAILLPVALIMILTIAKFKTRAYISIFFSFVAFIAATIISRLLFPISEMYIWTPSWQSIIMNITRIRTYISIGLSFGIPGIVSVWYILHIFLSQKQSTVFFFYPLICGYIMSIAFCSFGLITVYSDGRYIWPIYVFSIPLLALYLNEKKLTKKSIV